jgi:hypothetical protein
MKRTILLLALAALAGACGSGGDSSPNATVGCTSGVLHCNMQGDDLCCPTDEPYICSSPPDLANLGCYASMAEAKAVCGSYTFDGKPMTLAYKCQ